MARMISGEGFLGPASGAVEGVLPRVRRPGSHARPKKSQGSWKNKWGSRGRCPLAAGGTVPPAAGGEPPPDPHLFFHKPLREIIRQLFLPPCADTDSLRRARQPKETWGAPSNLQTAPATKLASGASNVADRAQGWHPRVTDHGAIAHVPQGVATCGAHSKP